MLTARAYPLVKKLTMWSMFCATHKRMNERATVYRLALETCLGARTVGRVLAGERVRPATRKAVEVAARKLRIKLPSTAANTSTPHEAA